MTLIDGKKRGPNESDLILKQIGAKRRWAEYFANTRRRLGVDAHYFDERLGLEPGTYQSWELGFRLPEIKVLGNLWPDLDMTANLEFQTLFTELKSRAQEYHHLKTNPFAG